MKVKSGVEQAVCILVMLATQSNQQYVKSDTISTRLNVSPSYLKKVMRKLVVHELIKSTPGNSGGFSLARPAESITMLDIVGAIEGEGSFMRSEGLIERVFPETDAAKIGSLQLEAIFSDAQDAYFHSLKKVTLKDALLSTLNRESIQLVDWNDSFGQTDIKKLQKER
ncbi:MULTISPECIES: Rrf2 family transcriptional regulator [Shouchella]|uniref:HTH-type transcriptional regulator n=2 Tax=Bacillaceae TaxID=186817 RepID=A0A060LWK6_9BACI|nr:MULTISPECIES: Rrf2 family transcriptional regulator [Bacillaceae]AIC95656.1 HTH-type transcriptional regulator [Shouchella lehensis G1]KQL57064.1 hypothetical protein AN965_10325 [Alkalicoccobacillus plakortidis]RQW21371.1 Rrf2 family transcriptional regulator [Bacillus sp. C1-1]